MVKKAFLSSVSGELAHYRNVVYNAVQRLDDWVCLRMEDFGASALLQKISLVSAQRNATFLSLS